MKKIRTKKLLAVLLSALLLVNMIPRSVYSEEITETAVEVQENTSEQIVDTVSVEGNDTTDQENEMEATESVVEVVAEQSEVPEATAEVAPAEETKTEETASETVVEETTVEVESEALNEEELPETSQEGSVEAGTETEDEAVLDQESDVEEAEVSDETIDETADTETEQEEEVLDEEIKTEEAEKTEEGEEVEEEPAYPEVELSETVNGVTIVVYAPEGSVPEGTQLSVTPVTAQEIFAAVESELQNQGMVLTDAVAFDIKLVDADGNEVQPNPDYPVTVSFLGTNLNVEEEGSVSVYCVADDGSSATEVTTETATAEAQEFVTDHFTIYVAGGSTSDPNGDGSGPNTPNNPYVLKYGESITLRSNNGLFVSNWSVSPTRGTRFANNVLTNRNQTQETINVRVSHTYNILGSTEYFYVTVLPQQLKVDFQLKDAGESEYTSVKEELVYFRGTATAPEMAETKEVDGKTYQFFGWYTDDTCTTEASLSNITADTTVYGKYTTLSKIHYVKNTSDAASVPADLEGGVGNDVQLGTASGRLGYVFDSWNTVADGSGDKYEAGESVTMPEEGMTLYAQWDNSVDARVIMHYYRNFNYFDDRVWETVSNIPMNSQTNLREEIPTRDGYIFIGWSISRNGDPDYYPGQTYYTTQDSPVDLYAQWGQLAPENLDYQTLTAKGETVSYDGTLHTIEGVEEGESSGHPGYVQVGTESFIVPWDVYADISQIKASGLHAGHYPTPIAAELFYQGPFGGMISLNQYIEVTNNVLHITQAEITISTDSAEKDYDGTELTAGGKVTFSDGREETFTPEGDLVSLLGEDSLNLKTTGSQTEPGESENGYILDWGKPEDWGGSANARKYDYKIVDGDVGTLKVNDIEYQFTKGDGNEWTKGSDTTSDFEVTSSFADPASYEGFSGIKVDDAEVDPTNYTISGEGPIEIILNADYLETLDGGEHTITAVFTDALGKEKTCEAKFSVTVPEPTPEPEPTPGPRPRPTPSDSSDDSSDSSSTPAVTPASVTPSPVTPSEPAEIPDEPTPEVEPVTPSTPEETVPDEPVPQTDPKKNWALVNLIALIGSVVAAAVGVLKNKNNAKFFSLIPAIGSVVFFALTEDLSGKMAMVDKYTIPMLAVAAVSALIGYFTRDKEDDSDEEE